MKVALNLFCVVTQLMASVVPINDVNYVAYPLHDKTINPRFFFFLFLLVIEIMKARLLECGVDYGRRSSDCG